jgi:hypothetical protein
MKGGKAIKVEAFFDLEAYNKVMRGVPVHEAIRAPRGSPRT